MQLLISQGTLVTGLAFPQNRDLVLARSGQVAVEAVVRDVEFRIGEPACEGRVPIEYLGPFLKPVNLAFGDFTPEGVRILLGSAVEIEVAFHALDVGFADEFFAGRVDGRGAHRKDDCNKPEYFRGASILSITPTSRGFVARTPSTAVPRMLF